MNLPKQLHQPLKIPEYPYLDSANNQLIGYTGECKHAFQCGYLRCLCTNPKCISKFCLYGWYTAGLVSDQLCSHMEPNPRWRSVSFDYFLNRRVMIERMIEANEVHDQREIPEEALSLSSINEYMFKPVNVFLLGCDESTAMDEILARWPWLSHGVGKPIFKVSINENLDEFIQAFTNAIPDVPSMGMVPCIILRWTDVSPEYEDACMKVIRDFETVQTVNIATRMMHASEIQTNEIMNLAWLNHSKWIYDLHDQFKGKPAICIAGGPSLAKLMPDIKRLQSSHLIIAVSTVAETLINHGIEPHIIATVDMKPHNRVYLDQMSNHKPYLAFDLDANHETVDSYQGPKIMIGSNLEVLPVTADILNYTKVPCEFPKSGTVSTTVYNIAVLLGASEILLAGYDLCYYGTDSHAPGVRTNATVRVIRDDHDTYLQFSHTPNKVEQAIEVETYEGTAWTSKAFYTYSLELGFRIRESGVPTYDLSPNVIKKTSVLDLSKRVAGAVFDPRVIIDAVPTKRWTNSIAKRIIRAPIDGTQWELVKYNHDAKNTYLLKQYNQFDILKYGNIMNQLENLVNQSVKELKTIVANALAKWKELNNGRKE